MEDKKGLRGHLRNSIKRNVQDTNKQEIIETEVKQEKQVLKDVKENKVKQEKKATFILSEDVLEMIEREAYWERYSVKEVVQQIFKAHYDNKKYDPIPEDRRPSRRGPKPKHSI